jgi:hypothetical protein
MFLRHSGHVTADRCDYFEGSIFRDTPYTCNRVQCELNPFERISFLKCWFINFGSYFTLHIKLGKYTFETC